MKVYVKGGGWFLTSQKGSSGENELPGERSVVSGQWTSQFPFLKSPKSTFKNSVPVPREEKGKSRVSSRSYDPVFWVLR